MTYHVTVIVRHNTSTNPFPSIYFSDFSNNSMVFYKTEFSGYSVKFSPLNPKLIACATAQYFGIVGNGKQEVLELTDRGLVAVAGFYTQDGVFDCAWSEENESHLVSVCGDGSTKLWDVRQRSGRPLLAWKEGRAELNWVDWSPLHKGLFATCAWDGAIRIHSAASPQSLRTLTEHEGCVYSVAWDPSTADRLASAGSDRTVRLWDARSGRVQQTIVAHSQEVLSVDWAAAPHTLCSASVDKTLRVWDLRRPLTPLFELHAHTYAVRRVKAARHWKGILLSVSYDRSFALWDLERPAQGLDPLVERTPLHQEFALGCDLSPHSPGLAATCGWDNKLAVWTLGKDPAV